MSDIKQKINDLETNLIKIKKFKNKPIDKYSHKEKILVQKFITGIKEFKNKPMGEKQLFKDFDDLSNNEIYLINIKEIISKGKEIINVIKNFYKDLFMEKEPRFTLRKGGIGFKLKE